MPPPDRIFRQAALDRLSSPEQLDQLMQVTTPKSWLALAAFGALLSTALVWAVFGRIADQVHGRGIFLKSDGVFLVAARGDGAVQELLARHGDVVTNGQLLARIRQPELEIKLRQSRTNYEAVAAALNELESTQQREQSFESTDWTTQRSMLERMITNYSAQILALTARTNVQAELLGKGLVSQSQYLDAQNALFTAQHDLYRTRVQLQQLEMAQFQAGVRRRQTLVDRQEQRQQALHQVEYLSNLWVLNMEVRSPYPGQVLEVTVKQGDLISPNTPIATLQGATNELEARLFLNSSDGKRLASRFYRMRQTKPSNSDPAASMTGPIEALLSPVSVRKEEFGLMRATVDDVSEYPVTPQRMLRVLQNPTLVNEFSQAGAPIEVTLRLERSADTASGFVWTSLKGPPMAITSGTLCDGTITISRRRPISLVLPFLTKLIGN